MDVTTPTVDGIQASTPSTPSSQIIPVPGGAYNGYVAATPGSLSPSLVAHPALIDRVGVADVNSALYAEASLAGGAEQPVFNLDDLQNFFAWGATGDENAQSTGFEGFGPLGWANNFSIM